MMLAAPFATGVGIYAFYALQPFLLELYGDPDAYAVAGSAAAIVAGSQILGGYAAPEDPTAVQEADDGADPRAVAQRLSSRSSA